jgi:succinate dehydrogenase/fumarate reductase flavoprotein subunit
MTLTSPPPVATHPRLDSKSPPGPIAEKWDTYRDGVRLVNPNNKRKFKIIVVGTGLAGASAAATLAELGYQVDAFTFHDSPRRAHSIAAQGGINAAKNYRGDGDSIHRLFYDTVKGGDFRARESNVYRLAQASVDIIDQMVAQGVPFAREYGGLLDNRSFGGAQVSRTFYARGQTGQQLLLGAYQQMERQIGLGTVRLFNRMELIDTVVVDGVCAGIVVRDLLTGDIQSHAAHAVVLATGGYGNVFFLSTNAMACNVTAAWRAHRRGAFFANPCYTQIHPTCIPQSDETQSKLTLMSESLRNDGRVWVPKNPDESRRADQVPEDERDYYLERLYPSFGNLAPRDISSARAKRAVDSGRGVGPLKNGVYLDFSAAVSRLGKPLVEERYGNLFEMYERITGEDPYTVPMRIYPASHYTMGGLWVDYELMTTIPACTAPARRTSATTAPTASARRRSCRDCPTATSCCRTRSATTSRRCSTSRSPASTIRRSRPPSRRRASGSPASCRSRDALAGLVPPRARQDHLGLLRHGAHGAGARQGAVRAAGALRRVHEGPARHRRRQQRQPDAREGGTRGGLLRARHADVPRRTRSQGELRRTLPLGVPGRGRRSET